MSRSFSFYVGLVGMTVDRTPMASPSSDGTLAMSASYPCVTMLPGSESQNSDPTDLEFTEIYKAYRSLVRDVIFKIADEGVDIEALTQETFLRFLTRLKRGEEIKKPQALLRKIAHELAIDHNRSASKRVVATDALPESGTLLSVSEPLGPEQAFEFTELLDSIKTVLGPELRNALLLRRYIGLTPRVTAEILGIQSATVSTNVRRAKETLLKHYSNSTTAPSPGHTDS